MTANTELSIRNGNVKDWWYTNSQETRVMHVYHTHTRDCIVIHTSPLHHVLHTISKRNGLVTHNDRMHNPLVLVITVCFY